MLFIRIFMGGDDMIGDFRLLMISAMYENGGNTTHRFLDGHPQMLVYPFESQLGTRLVNDSLSSIFPAKYRWPVFALDSTPLCDYKAIIDEETRVRARTPHVSKFRHVNFIFSDDERRDIYLEYIKETGRSRAFNVAAFFRATFEAWKNRSGSGREMVYVGYSPIVVVDAEKIIEDFPGSHVLHVVRNPWSAYADTKKRPAPMPLKDYMTAWTISQYFALLFSKRYPGRVKILRFEDLIEDPRGVLGRICGEMGLEDSDTLGIPTWNGLELTEVFPWGTIRRATPDANRATAEELSPEERGEVRERALHYLDALGYSDFI